MTTFRVLPWAYGNEADLDDEGVDVVCDTAENAALGFVEDNYAALECPKTADVFVRRSGSNVIQKVKVTVEMYPRFSAILQSKGEE